MSTPTAPRLHFLSARVSLCLCLTSPGLIIAQRSLPSSWFGFDAGAEALGETAPPAPARTTRGASKTEVKVDPDGYTAARVCGECHADIYRTWKSSMHSFSLSDPIFDTAYMQAVREGGDEAKRLCLRCHAPMTMANGDYDLKEGVTRDGVSCDFCHTVTAVRLDHPDTPYSLEPGLVKRGIIKKAASPAHEVAYSELHGTSEFCGGCHNYVAPGGAAIMSTYDEWRGGPYAREGIQCQNCHMVLGPGKVVREDVKPTGPQIHLHSLIHDSDQVRSALALQILSVDRSGGRLRADVQVENVGSGHMVPTGLPTREIILTVTVDVDGRTLTQERRYRKVVADERNRVLEQDYEVLLRGRKVLNDNRIAPREKRLERFDFDVPSSARVKVKADLSYLYAPMVLARRPVEIKMSEAERFVN
jgi:hypothetical protein